MAWVNKNFSYSTLNGGVLIGATSMTLANGAVFPATGDFMCVIWDQTYANPSYDSTAELVKCTARSTHVLTITRAQEGTAAKAWNSGDKVAHVYTAGILDTVALLDATQTLTNKTLTTPTIASMANANHNHAAGAGGGVIPASSIGSGTLVHERGGLEADVSAYSGLVKISGGVTSAVTAPTSTIVGISDTQTLSNKTISNSSLARAYRSSSQSLTNGLASTVEFNAESYDLGSNFSSYVYTTPSTGYYRIAAQLVAYATGGTISTLQAYLYTTGSTALSFKSHSGISASSYASIDLFNLSYLDSGALIYAEVTAYFTGTCVLVAGTQYNFITIEKVAG